jgi:glutamate-1-semialdehyde 2,1-aminomutase
MRSGKASRQMFERAKRVMPKGVASNFRYWGDDKTLVLKRAQGAYIWDQDDKRYIDYRLGFGPVVLGHAHKAVTNRVREALEIGNTFAMTTEYEIEAAEKITALTGVDMVRYANSGTEATTIPCGTAIHRFPERGTARHRSGWLTVRGFPT